MQTPQYLETIYRTLLDTYGPQHWWPADTRLEIMVGAILTQNTNWANVEKAIANLKAHDLLDFDSLARLHTAELAALIRPAGYYNIKAGRLACLLNHIQEHHNGDPDAFLDQDGDALRRELLGIKGIGPETADSIILYAAAKPVFVIDTYTHRVLSRHGLIGEEAGYYEMQQLFMDNLEEDVTLFKEYHALLVRVGKTCCKKSRPRCDHCPLVHLR